jgi:ribose transport system ATP-binding protein
MSKSRKRKKIKSRSRSTSTNAVDGDPTFVSRCRFFSVLLCVTSVPLWFLPFEPMQPQRHGGHTEKHRGARLAEKFLEHSNSPTRPRMIPRLRMNGIAKRYGPTVALSGVDLTVLPGEVQALVGENGAGKSTLMKVLSGAESPDAGTMQLDGRTYSPSGPAAARRAGVGMVYQELSIAPDLSVAENILLGQEGSRFGFLRRDADRERVAKVLGVLEHPEIHPDAPAGELGPAARQLVEIARVLLTDLKILVLDEPTSALSHEDTERLFALIRRLKQRSVSIVYISHFLEEVGAIADRFTVLRDGKAVGEGLVGEVPQSRIIEMMVGRTLDEQYPRIPHTPGEPLLHLDKLSGTELPRDAELTLHRGEILGVAGLVGSGRTEMLRAVFGLDPVRSGEVTVHLVHGPASPARRIRQGLGLLSEDRKDEGLALDQSIADNLTYSWLRPYRTLGLINNRKRKAATASVLATLNTRYRDPDQAVGELSGGNQQKVALGRLLHQQADVLLLDEPTRGVDVGSKAEIYRLIGELAAQGKAVLMVSSYLPELFGVCDSLAVMSRGQLSPTRPIQQWTHEQVMAVASGAA